MLQLPQFDVKTGKPIQVSIEGQYQTAIKQIENSYLEHWCQVNNISLEERFFVARFYESVHDSDRQRLESDGKYLVFSSGNEGYFTDFKTAQLMTLGSETVTPLYAGDRDAPHNAVAYGGLIASDGVSSTTLASARILVIDDEQRVHGNTPLVDRTGQPIPSDQINQLYDRLGDGTMLVPDTTMRALQTREEREAAGTSEPKELALARHSVYQFRAASPERPGIAKGTMSSSQWCDRLGVDAIISLNDIKGDDGRLSALGIQTVSNFWVNRKATAKYGQQTIGPQVKYTIPEATRLEINPLVQKKAAQLAEVAGDYDALSQRYLKHKEHEHSRPYQALDDETFNTSRPDWLYASLSADKYGQLTDEAHIVRGLRYYIKGEWQRLSANGTSAPSAMAQHHSQLKPWEICNRDLPHGVIVAYYRSPFPNVGAAAIAINNTEVIKHQDPEAFAKQGVAYLPPGTAKNIAITDFDGDINGFFVGYQACIGDLPQQIRAELKDAEGLSPAQQYEAGRAMFSQMIHQLEKGREHRIEPSIYPVAVKEFTERTAPDVRPPQIAKQKKEKHPWREGESYSVATWRAWGITADNPTGKVANAGMSLQALVLELRYAPDEKKEALLSQVSRHFSTVLKRADLPENAPEKIIIPSDDWLTAQGFSPFYRERMEELAGASGEVSAYESKQQRQQVAEPYLQAAARFLFEVANGPNAVNLQTAVDTAKSAKGIDEPLHKFVKALQYKPDELRRNKNNPLIYGGHKVMPTSIDEPVSWGVQQVNEQYSGAQLLERKHEAFQAIFPKGETLQQEQQAKAIIQTYSSLTKEASDSKSRHRQRRPEDQKPTVQVTLSDGRQLAFHNIDDSQGTFPWRGEGAQPSWKIHITKDPTANAAGRRFPAKLTFTDNQGQERIENMGYVTESSVERYSLERRIRPGQSRTITAPHVTTQVPWAQRNDTEMLYDQRERYIVQALAPPDGKGPQAHSQDMALALWRQSKGGRKLMMLQYPERLRDRLQRLPKLTLNRLQVSAVDKQQLFDEQVHTIRFGRGEFALKGQPTIVPTVSVVKPEGEVLLGTVASRDIALPDGATYLAVLSRCSTSDKAMDVEVMDLPTIEQTPAEIAAMHEGRGHLTFDYEPYAAYGVRAGDIVVAQAPEGGEQVALQVKEQHIIDEGMAALGAQRWAEAEKTSPSVLFQQLAAARSDGKTLWGLNVQPLGTYERGQIKPFEMMTDELTAESLILGSPSVEYVRPPLSPEKANAQTGVMAALSRANPKLRQQLAQVVPDGKATKLEQGAIAPHNQQNAEPSKQAGKDTTNQTPAKSRTQSQRKRQQSKDNGMGY